MRVTLIKEKRVEKGLSQKELADMSGVPQQTISAIETGSRDPVAETLYLLAKALDTTMDEIYKPDKRSEGA